MLGSARRLALEVEDLPSARDFYAETLELPVEQTTNDEVVLAAGDCRLALRPVGCFPRGGAHVHYAFSVPPDEYGRWYDALDANHDLEERTFGDARSLYCFDPAGHCVELGERGEGDGITGIFEVVLEVTDLEEARQRYEAVGFSVVDRGGDRRRVRLSTGDLDLELWEPQYGIADARGGVHVDFAVVAEDPVGIADSLDDDDWRIERTADGVVLLDWDGHRLTLRSNPGAT